MGETTDSHNFAIGIYGGHQKEVLGVGEACSRGSQFTYDIGEGCQGD